MQILIWTNILTASHRKTFILLFRFCLIISKYKFILYSKVCVYVYVYKNPMQFILFVHIFFLAINFIFLSFLCDYSHSFYKFPFPSIRIMYQNIRKLCYTLCYLSAFCVINKIPGCPLVWDLLLSLNMFTYSVWIVEILPFLKFDDWN